MKATKQALVENLSDPCIQEKIDETCGIILSWHYFGFCMCIDVVAMSHVKIT